MYAQKYLMALKQNIAHTLKKLWLYLVVCTATRTHCKNLRWWDAHRNAAPQQKIMQFMHLNAEVSERRLIAQSLDLSINEMVITNN